MSVANLPVKKRSHVVPHLAQKETPRRTWGVPVRLVPDDVADDQSQASREIVRMFTANYETAAQTVRDRRVLDMACGSGYGSHLLKNAGACHVVGVDLSAETVEYAARRYGGSGIEFIAQDGERYNSPERFDVAVSYETIQYVPSPEKFLDKLHRLLLPGGTLFMSLPLGNSPLDPAKKHRFSREQIFRLLEKSGFTVEACRLQPWKIRPADLASWRTRYPDEQATITDLLFTSRGRSLLWQLICGMGSLTIRELLIKARNTAPTAPVDPDNVPPL